MYKIVLIFFVMIFLHIVDDYYLQGCLAKMKQESFWKDIIKDYPICKFDYLVALLCHGFSWSFMVHLPFTIITFKDEKYSSIILWSLISNAFLHSFIDNLKCNCKVINLVIDQTLHLIQIICILLVLCKFYL